MVPYDKLLSGLVQNTQEWLSHYGGLWGIAALTLGLLIGNWMGKRRARIKPEMKPAPNDAVSDPGATVREVEMETRIWDRLVDVKKIFRLPRPADRHMRVISFCNLKGGVGKTTLTANIAATLANRGKKVLLIDLDHQRSLTLLALTAKQLSDFRLADNAIHSLFNPDERCVDLLYQIFRQVSGYEDRLRLVAAHSKLSAIEDQAMLNWLMTPGSPDVRFALTGELVSSQLRDWPDYVLLDCPPRFTTASINALVASDFIVAPIIPDVVSSDAIPFFVQSLQTLAHLFPADGLEKRLGLVANRCRPAFTPEAGYWDKIILSCPTEWRARMIGFQSAISDRVSFSKAAENIALLKRGFAIDEREHANVPIASQFNALCDELEAVLR